MLLSYFHILVLIELICILNNTLWWWEYQGRVFHLFCVKGGNIKAHPKVWVCRVCPPKPSPLFPLFHITKDNSQGEIMPDERVLHYRIGIPRKHLQMILKEANRPKATLHSFRVTFNNLLLAEKLTIEDRQSLMAHSSSNTTSVYTHPNLELAREYINKLPTYSSGKNVTKVWPKCDQSGNKWVHLSTFNCTQSHP